MSKELEEVNKRIEKIEKEQLVPLRKKRDALRDAEDIRKCLSLVGKTFAYRGNHYSWPKKPEDYWDVYKKVVGLCEDGVKVLSVQKCALGEITIKLEDSYQAIDVENLEEIPEEEFDSEYKRLISEVENLK